MIPPEGRLPIRVLALEGAEDGIFDHDSSDDMFRLLYLECGSMIVSIDGRTLSLVAPCCLWR